VPVYNQCGFWSGDFQWNFDFFHEFSHLFESYGQVPAVDQATAKHTNFRGAQVRVNCYDIVQLPPV
jgi:hypothetical protein